MLSRVAATPQKRPHPERRNSLAVWQEGFTQDDVAKALQTAPLEPPMAEALREAQKSCQAIWICSDANTFFIETILQAHDLRDVITGVITCVACPREPARGSS